MRILFLAFRFPPHAHVGGRRSYFFAKYLAAMGHEVSLVTSADAPERDWTWDVDRTFLKNKVELPVSSDPADFNPLARLLVRLLHRLGKNGRGFGYRALWRLCSLALPLDFDRRWVFDDAALAEAVGPIDVIIASGGPWSMFEYGARLKTQLGARLVLDYRDVWTARDASVAIESLNRFGSGLSGRWVSRRLDRMEQRLLAAADGFFTVSGAIYENVLALGGSVPGTVVFNGHDPAESMESPTSGSDESTFQVVYTGQLRAEQRVDRFLAGLEVLFEERPELVGRIRIDFVGSRVSHPTVLRRFDSFPYPASIRVTDFMPKREAMEILQSADVLLQLSYEGTRGIMSSKIFQYISAGRPILLISNVDDCMERVITDTKTGFLAKTPEETASFLSEAFEQWAQGRSLAYAPDHQAIAFYSFENQATILDGFLRELR